MNTHDNTDDGDASSHDDAALSPLQQMWIEHVSSDIALLDRLITRYRERQRKYHKISHIEAMLAHVAELAEHETVVDIGTVVAAVFYHDAIYEPMHPANERASARLARRDLATLGWGEQRAGTVSDMIEATASHTDPATNDMAVLFDADLAILGADAATYAVYAAKVRAEYTHVDDREWRTGRRTVLEGFADRDALFATPTGRALWDSSARTNIAAELATLGG